MSFESALIALFAIATAVAIGARWLRIPYTVALVLAGLGLGFTHVLSPPHLTKAMLYSVFLPGLIFEAAFHLEVKHFRRNVTVIGALSVPGVVACGLLVALLLSAVMRLFGVATHFGFGPALVFGALIAATDPIAVVALFKTLGVPHRLALLVESESLINDGTAVAFYGVVLAAVAGDGVSVASGALQFIHVAGLGVVVGGVIGFGISRVIRRVDDPMVEITLTTIAAYGSFVAGESIHASGVIATVAAAMFCGNYAMREGMSASTRVAVETFWEYVAFGLNSLVFLLIGLQVHIGELVASWRLILLTYLIVTVARAVLVFAVAAAVLPTRERMPWSWATVLSWGGLRGALSMVLALSLPAEFPHAATIVTMTFGVVVLSILVQGMTMSPLLRVLGIVKPSASRGLNEARGTVVATRAVLDALALVQVDETSSQDTVTALRDEYTRTLEKAELAVSTVAAGDGGAGERARQLRRRLILVERDALLEAHRRGVIDRRALDELLHERDQKLRELERDLAEDE
ncbi:MAG TPA: cation:proton antiporter [Polyangia bacterium]|jgi:CPA1 family monovalent cation:H+ antiporter|nr:cation:proton antiporter [Polyangia bacterium]